MLRQKLTREHHVGHGGICVQSNGLSHFRRLEATILLMQCWKQLSVRSDKIFDEQRQSFASVVELCRQFTQAVTLHILGETIQYAPTFRLVGRHMPVRKKRHSPGEDVCRLICPYGPKSAQSIN